MVRVKGQDLKQLDELGDSYSNKVIRSLRKVINQVADNYESPEDINVITDLWDSEVDNGLLEDLEDVWVNGAEHIRDQLVRHAKEADESLTEDSLTAAIEIPPIQNQAAIEYVLARDPFIRNIAIDAWEIISGILVEGIEQGKSIGEIKEDIKEALGISSPRAEVIARTEVVGASNAGSYNQMKASGLPAQKEWLATNDDRTRHSHTEADGQTVNLDQPFTVGGFPMERPHDPAGPAAEVVNCRCTIVFNIPDEALVGPSDLGPSITAAASKFTTGMIALVPSDKDLDKLVLEGREPKEELHLTLWFLGEMSDLPEGIEDKIESSIRTNIDDLKVPPAQGFAFGVNHWNPSSEDPAWVLAVGNNSEGTLDLEDYKTLTGIPLEGVDIAINHTPWIPHVTLAYTTDNLVDDIGQSRLGEITFDKIRLAFGDNVRDIPLAKLQEQDNEMPWSKVQNHSDCPSDRPWAVVKDETGEVEGCHATEEDANDQLATLNAAEEDSSMEAETLLDDIKNAEIVDLGDKASWTGVLVVEGIPTGDGREFSPDSLVWEKLPIPLRWNKEDSHGGEPRTVAVNVGKITEIWRDGQNIRGKGIFDLGSKDGAEAHRLVEQGFLSGISIDADDISEQDIEVIFPEDTNPDAEFLMPEKMVFHHGRIRAATLVDIPAFIEAEIDLDHIVEGLTAGAVGSHDTATTDEPWDGSANEQRLDSPLTLAKARAMYAWFDSDSVEDGELPKSAAKFPHHMVSDDGNVGAANLQACSSGIAALNGARGGVDIPRDDMQGVYNHLANHLRDADREVPEAQFNKVNEYFKEVVTASVMIDSDAPPKQWFQNPKLSVLTGVTVTDEGRIYGHAAEWNACHVGIPDVCVTPPEEDLHPYFMTGEIICSDGSRVGVGQITVSTGHPNLGMNAKKATEHYDNTGAAVADVAVGNDEHGIWLAGAIRPDAEPNRVRELMASGRVSGDWRRIGGQLRLVGLLGVNVAGYAIPQTQVRVASGAPLSLVAAGQLSIGKVRALDKKEELKKQNLKAMAESIARRVGLDK